MEGRSFVGTTVPSNSYVDITITFSKSHQKVPLVVTTLAGVADTVHRASVNISIYEKTKAGFKARIYNGSAAQMTIAFDWIAYEA